jgi:hypothetical protein
MDPHRPPKGKRIGKKGGILMVSPPGRQPAKKKRRSAASFGGGGQSLGNGSAASSSGGFRNQGNDPNQNPTFPTGSASAAPAASPRGADDAAARAERLAAFERRAAAGAQRERLNEFECAICLEAFKGSACPGGRDRVACLPCGHAMFCAPCAAKFRRCPQGCDGFRGILKLFL